jgi:OmpA-OmpF porin, OOP family
VAHGARKRPGKAAFLLQAYPTTPSKGRIVKRKSLPRQLSLTSVVLGLAALTLGSAAQAQSGGMGSMGSMSMYTPGSGYIGFNAGRSHYGDRTLNLTGFVNDRNNNAYSLYAGSYFNQYLGLELGYNDFGRISRAGGTSRANGVSLSLVGRAPIGQSFAVLGRVGGTYLRTDVSASPLAGIQTGRDSKFDVSYGIGAEYNFTPQFSAVLQYDEYNPRFAGGYKERLNTTTIGIRYHF